MNSWDDLEAGRERWQSLLDEAAGVRLARRVAPRPALRERVAAALTVLAVRLAPRAEGLPADATR